MRSLSPDDVLVRAPEGALDWQSDGRLLVHHRLGTSLLDGVEQSEAERVLAAVDGRRTAIEVCRFLAPEIPPERSRRLLRLWFGELLVLREVGPPTPSAVATGPRDGSPRAGQIATIGVLGGGSAGHLAALALRRALPTCEVTLVESPRRPVIGVGEATTPLMPQFLHADLGLDFESFWQQVRPTLKLGIQFVWGPGAEAVFPYPFGPMEPALAKAVDGHLRRVSSRGLMMTTQRLPSPSKVTALGTEVAYHLDNRRFVGWLAEQSTAHGVHSLRAEVVDVEVDAEGRRIEALRTDQGQRLTFDLYLDCSGFASRLLGQALGVPWKSFRASLFNDRALVGATPRSGPPAPHTEARAMSAGWCWNTPERASDHRGYVYSADFLDDDRAEAEFRALFPDLVEVRRLRFCSGRHERFRHGNVVALGNAYGFVEPLESTALHLLIRQIGWLAEGLAADDPDHAWSVIDTRCAQAWDYLAWFLALHFRFNRAMDTEYWRACRSQCDVEQHRELITSFERRGPLTSDPLVSVEATGFNAPDPLWGPEGIDLLLLGQRLPHSPAPVKRRFADRWRRQVEGWQHGLADGIDQGRWLAELDRSPDLRRRFVEAFERHGPAFPSLAVLAEGGGLA